jgi:exodeoxyribonuclease VII large subunit
VPVVSAVGHEIDFTTSDLAADVRAATPSAAAEILSADRAETLDRLRAAARRLHRDAGVHLAGHRAQLELRTSSGVFRLPVRQIGDLRLQTDDLHERAGSAVLSRLGTLQQQTGRAVAVLAARSPAARLSSLSDRLVSLRHRQTQAASAFLRQRRQRHERHAHALELLGPRQTLARGFTITMDAKRRPLVSSKQAAEQKEIVTLFADGEIKSRPQ